MALDHGAEVRCVDPSNTNSPTVGSTNSLSLAILSVFDKTGLLDLAKGLDSKGVRLLASGGTAKLIREAGIKIE